MLYYLLLSPQLRVRNWPAYFINGYNFYTQEYGIGKAIMNNGVSVRSFNGGSSKDNFYNLLDEIIEIKYPRPLMMRVVLFKYK